MHCKKCGTELPNNAEYCYECGAKVKNTQDQVKKSDETTITFDKRVFTTALLFLGLTICVVLAIMFDYANQKAIENQHQFRQDSVEAETTEESQEEPLSENAILLQGQIEVGENKDLPAGKYEIRGVEDSHYIFIQITKEGDKDYEEYINTYQTVRNYVLKEGYILDVGHETAFTKLD